MQQTTTDKTFRRGRIPEKTHEQIFDVIVIGGGITGAGIALDAASRGLKTVLIEKNDFASGTSSRSTKLIHGGLRYLATYEFRLVREVGKERKILLRNASHLVYPEKMLLPVIKGGTYSKLKMNLGLLIYDRLAGVSKTEKRVMLDATEALETEPLLNKKILKGAGLYTEYRTDDARLTIEVVKTANRYGAGCFNYVTALGFMYDSEKKVCGVKCVDNLNKENFALSGKFIVNAAGPWVEEIMDMDETTKNILCHTKGVHIVIPKEKIPLKQAVYFDATDGRMVFAIPREETVYIGTTDTFFSDNLNDPRVDQNDAAYLLNTVNRIFPGLNLSPADIISSWAGIRPLILEKGKKPSAISRKDEIFLSKSGLITIAGGKLTGYRKMAEKVVDLIRAKIPERGNSIGASITKDIILTGGNLSSVKTYTENLIVMGKETGIEPDEVMRLYFKYGSETEKIFEIFGENKKETKSANRLLEAEIDYCVTYESVTGLNDFLIRRTGILNFSSGKLDSVINIAAERLATLLGWTEETKSNQLKEFNKARKLALSPASSF